MVTRTPSILCLYVEYLSCLQMYGSLRDKTRLILVSFVDKPYYVIIIIIIIITIIMSIIVVVVVTIIVIAMVFKL